MVIFGQTQGLVGGAMSGGKGLVVPSLLRDKEAGKAKVNINLVKIIINFNKVREEVKTLRKVIFSFIRNL